MKGTRRKGRRLPTVETILFCMSIIATCYLMWAYVLTYAEYALDSDLALCSEEYGQTVEVLTLQAEHPDVLIGGEAKWSIFPPGWTCSFGLANSQHKVVKDPGAIRGVGTALSLGILGLYVLLRGRWRSTSSRRGKTGVRRR